MRNRGGPKQQPPAAQSAQGGLCAYEIARNMNVDRNKKALRAMGVEAAKAALAEAAKVAPAGKENKKNPQARS